jgi:hypothetical protein
VLYLAWVVSPALHQLEQHLERHGASCDPCAADDPGWRTLSHPPDQPCSDPDHPHHRRPAHDEDHCLVCGLIGATVGALPFAEAQARPAEVARPVAVRTVLPPLSPELLVLSPRAPPAHPSA